MYIYKYVYTNGYTIYVYFCFSQPDTDTKIKFHNCTHTYTPSCLGRTSPLAQCHFSFRPTDGPNTTMSPHVHFLPHLGRTISTSPFDLFKMFSLLLRGMSTETEPNFLTIQLFTHVSFTMSPTHTTRTSKLPLPLYHATRSTLLKPSNPWINPLHAQTL